MKDDGNIDKLQQDVAAPRRKLFEPEKAVPVCGTCGGDLYAINMIVPEVVAKFEAIISAIGDPVAIYDKEFRVLYQNLPHRELIGDHAGEYCYKAYKKRDHVCDPCAVALSFQDGGVHTVAKRATIGDKEIFVEITGSSLRDAGGNILAGIEVVRDITELKRREEELEQYRQRLEGLVKERTAELVKANELLQAEIAGRKHIEEDLLRTERLESLGVLAGGIAHDFNNLLSAVLGNISLAKRYATEGDKIYERLEEAERASSRAADLAQQLLAFAKGRVAVKKIISLPGLIRDAANFALRGSSTKCAFLVPDDLWAVEADDGQICQVINNIVLNAEQAMPEGGTIHVRCSNERIGPEHLHGVGSGRFVKIDIEDHGPGIAEENIGRIFDPYFTTKQEGSGLGLATAYSIIDKHNGTITVDSEQGNGTVFHIFLPAARGEAEDAGVQRKKLFSGKGKVLVMDDEDIIRMIVGSMLGEIGYDAFFAEDGEEALRLYGEAKSSGQPFDAVLLDLTIKGGMGGMECMKNLLEMDPGVKAVVSSGYAEDPILSNYRDFGFRDVITKPYQIEDLSEILFKVLRDDGR